MPWTRKTVGNSGEAADAVAAFLTRLNRAGAITPNAGNVGNGTVFGASADTNGVVETWTLVCTTNGGNGVGVFSVTGSVSGAQAAATVGIPYFNGIVSFTILGGSVDFTTGTPDDFTFDVAATTQNWEEQRGFASTARMGSPTADPGNTGNGTVGSLVGIASESATEETWTLNCTTGGPTGVAIFDVDGSVSGDAGSDVVVGTPYDNGRFSLLITAGGVDFITGDKFTFTQRPFEYIFKGIGSGSDEIYIGYKEKTNTTTYFNWDIQGFTGYVGANQFESQPAYEASLYSVQTDGSFDILIVENARRIIVVPIIGSVYGQIYLGWILPTATPSQWDYPILKGGDSDIATDTIGSTGASHVAWWKDAQASEIYDNSSWQLNSDMWPYEFYTVRKTEGGDLPLIPVTVINKTSGQFAIYGEADGCYYTDADDGAITIADSIIDDDEFFFIVQNVFRVGNNNLMALKLE